MDAVLAFSDEENPLNANGRFCGQARQLHRLRFGHGPFRVSTSRSTRRSLMPLFTQHHPDEFQSGPAQSCRRRSRPWHTQEYKPDHEHDEEVSSVGITIPGDLSEKKLERMAARPADEPRAGHFPHEGRS